jgi:Fic family protein
MTWNWQQPDWPSFRWDRTRLENAEKQFLVSGGVFVGSVRHLGKEERDQLTIAATSTEAVTTSEIEAIEVGVGPQCVSGGRLVEQLLIQIDEGVTA